MIRCLTVRLTPGQIYTSKMLWCTITFPASSTQRNSATSAPNMRKIKYLKRVDQFSFVPWNWDTEAPHVVAVRSLIPVSVELLAANVGGKVGYRLPREDHERVMRRNISR